MKKINDKLITEEITTEGRIEGLKRNIKSSQFIPKYLKSHCRNVVLALEHYSNTPDGSEDAIEGLDSYEKIIESYEMLGRITTAETRRALNEEGKYLSGLRTGKGEKQNDN